MRSGVLFSPLADWQPYISPGPYTRIHMMCQAVVSEPLRFHPRVVLHSWHPRQFGSPNAWNEMACVSEVEEESREGLRGNVGLYSAVYRKADDASPVSLAG